jgi:hypothetical protein
MNVWPSHIQTSPYQGLVHRIATKCQNLDIGPERCRVAAYYEVCMEPVSAGAFLQARLFLPSLV